VFGLPVVCYACTGNLVLVVQLGILLAETCTSGPNDNLLVDNGDTKLADNRSNLE
jgi:hypothetical protein